MALTFTTKKSTKFKVIEVSLKSGRKISGELHVPADASSNYRPADAIQEAGRLIGLVNAVIRDGDQESNCSFVHIPVEAIDWVAYPPEDQPWQKGHTYEPTGHKPLGGLGRT